MLTNPVIIGVIVMVALCLAKFNILLAIMVATVVVGLIAGMPLFSASEELVGTIPTFINGMSGNLETALSYILLGALAFAIQQSGLALIISKKLEAVFGKAKLVLLFAIAGIACLSQNLIPIHISFIPILIPALLPLMNELKIDRRGVATALTFGLQTPYMALPFGFGFIFHGIIAGAMTDNGVPFDTGDVWKSMIIPALGMVIGLLIAVLYSYRKPREYKTIQIEGQDIDNVDTTMTRKHWGAAIGAIAAFAIQLIAINSSAVDTTGALPLGALIGLLIMIAFGSIPYKDMDETVLGGIKMMGFIAFVMLAASGFGSVLRATGGVEELVNSISGMSKLTAAIVMLIIGLIITTGIGTSFGTIPIVAIIYVPLGVSVGFSPAAIALLIGVAGALGDAGSPASDSTLGPTAGLNVDGQHDHITDTCIPTFIHFNIPLLIAGVIGSMIL
ncbi:MAG: Na+/H+ antiporter family protein [Lachnospirales bacterium]